MEIILKKVFYFCAGIHWIFPFLHIFHTFQNNRQKSQILLVWFSPFLPNLYLAGYIRYNLLIDFYLRINYNLYIPSVVQPCQAAIIHELARKEVIVCD